MTNPIDPISYNAAIEAAKKLLLDRAQEQRDTNEKYPQHAKAYPSWVDRVYLYERAAEEVELLQRPEPQPAPASIVTCCVTGAIPGDGGACGDCDPCIMGEASVPDAVKRLIAEKNSLIARIGELEGTLAEVAGVDNIAPAPADAERLALAERIEQLDIEAFAFLCDMVEQQPEELEDAKRLIVSSLRAGGWREDMENGRHGFIVSSADETRFRFWDAMGPTWTTNRVRALRFARRIDAERFAAEDEDAWKILEVVPSAPHTDKEG